MQTKLKIGYKTFDVVYQPKVFLDNEEVSGYIDFDDGKICIKDELPLDSKNQTLLHEIFHGIENVFNIQLTEEQIDALATGFLTVAKDNNKFIQKILKG